MLGLALARLYLGYQGAIDNQVIVPLDDHLELYRDARRAAAELGRGGGLQRTDLALWSLDARRRTITCRLVEVKCYSAVRGVSVFEQLKTRIAEQLARSESVLASGFDPARELADRPDRAVRNAELAGIAALLSGPGGTARRRCAAMPLTRPAGCLGIWTAVGTGSSSPDRADIRPVGHRGELVRGRRDRVPPDRAGPHRRTACGNAHRSGAGGRGWRAIAELARCLAAKLADAAFRAPERSHETPAEPMAVSPRSSLDDLDADEPGLPDRAGAAPKPRPWRSLTAQPCRRWRASTRRNVHRRYGRDPSSPSS